MLGLAVEKTSVSTDCGTMLITDITGVYDNPDNLTGYGSPNEARANLYLKLILSLRKSTGRESIEIPSYNPNTVASWSVSITEPGWYEIFLFGCLAWNSGTEYDEDYVVYHTSTESYYKSLQSSNTNNLVTDTDWWEAITDIEDFQAAIDSEQSGVYSTTTNIAEICSLRKCEAQMLLKAQCDNCDECALKEYEKVRMKLEGIVYNESLGNFTEAQEIIENAQVICADIDCGCGCS
jgi:hypothetical protein